MTGALDLGLGPLVRSVLINEGHTTEISVVKDNHGRWQANMRRPDGKAYAVHVCDDPVEALTAILTPVHQKRLVGQMWTMQGKRSVNDPLKADLFGPLTQSERLRDAN